MAKHSYTVAITDPQGQKHTIVVKKSTQVALEESLGVPIYARIVEGYTGAMERLAYAVGLDAGVIPETLSFLDFLDGEDDWDITFVPPEEPINLEPAEGKS